MKFDANKAKDADKMSAAITESGMYKGVITRAEALVSDKKGTKGLGISFKTDDGMTADYLDIYYEKADGTELYGMNTVQAILGCLKIREPKEGPIKCKKYVKNKGVEEVSVNGYPNMMGKRIGFLLQKEIQTNEMTGQDQNRMNIYGVFEADTGFVVSEILEKKTKPEKLEKMLQFLMAHPVKDNRKKKAVQHDNAVPQSSEPFFDDDIPF